jgi:hypothetical protein
VKPETFYLNRFFKTRVTFKTWPSWHLAVADKKVTDSELRQRPPDLTKNKSEAVSSLMQVLSQLSKEIDKAGTI